MINNIDSHKKTEVMKTRYLLLAGLGVAAAAAIALLTTDRGKRMRKDLADNLTHWRARLAQYTTESANGSEKKASEKRLKQTV